MTVDTISISLIVFPLSIVDVTISVNQSSFAVGFVVHPPAFVHRSIRPYLSSFTLPDVFVHNPFTVILGVVLQLDHGPVFDRVLAVITLLIVVELTELLSDLLDLGIVVIFLHLGVRIILVHAHVDLRNANLLTREIAPDCGLDLNDQSKLLHCDPPA